MGLGDIIAENSVLFPSADNIALFTKIARYFRAIFENVLGMRTWPEIKPEFDFFFCHFAKQVFLQPEMSRVESKRPILESMPDWIHEEVEGAVAEEEEEDVTEQIQPPSSWTLTEGVVVGSSTSRGHQSLAHASSTGCQSPVLAPGASSFGGKAITFSHKRSRGNH
jgi:hypothetical protein